MDIKDFLAPADTMAGQRATDKARLLWQLAQHAASELRLPGDLIAEALLKREELGSTGMGEGVAIPHARLQAVKRPFGILVRLKQPIDFEAIDGKPVDLVFLLLLPAAPHGEQLNALACVSRKLRISEVREELRSAPDDAALHRVMVGQGN